MTRKLLLSIIMNSNSLRKIFLHNTKYISETRGSKILHMNLIQYILYCTYVIQLYCAPITIYSMITTWKIVFFFFFFFKKGKKKTIKENKNEKR
jgi:hypothetical protein